MENVYYKKGYLNNELQIFHLADKTLPKFEYHYHDFYKMLIHISGNVSYFIEGKEYLLEPYDTLLINPGEIHKPFVINTKSPYERIICYISDNFFNEAAKYNADLHNCFLEAKEHNSHLIRTNSAYSKLNLVIQDLLSSFGSLENANEFLYRIKVSEYLVYLNQLLLNSNNSFIQPSTENKLVLRTINYINNNLQKDLSVSSISQALFLHPSYLMHLFKKETGYTIGKYITEKRLFLGNKYIQLGHSITEACYMAGFNNYGTFYQAYRKKYCKSPAE